ncbi:ATPase, T2SS/T4P/T4SS family [Dapis sp. BLCC M172]|uniref:ATPase, T2SS/T4P/T4SS family n=1 Tax=Dapis sp. BLCC M172 TaxID=2975281 RepID=UPI003CEBAC67
MSAPISSSSSRGVSSVNYSYQRKAEKHHILSLHSGFFDNAELEDAEDELALEDIAQSISSISEDDFGFKSAELKDVAELKDAEDELALEDIAQSISEVDLFFENAELKDAWDELVVEDIAQSISAAEESPIIKAVNVILIKALTEGVSDIHVEPQKEFVRIRMGKDGVLRNYYRLPKKLTPAITSRFKIIAHLDIAEKQQAQSGRMRKVFKGRTIHFQVNSFPGSYGEKIVLRIEDAEDEDIAESISAAKDARITKTVKVILVKALTEGVSDIHVEPQKEFIRIRMGKDGVLRNYYRLPKKLTPAITSRFKIIAHLDIAEKQQAQSGRMRKVFKGRTIHFQVNSFPGSYGEKIVLQILDSSSIDTDTPLQLIQTIGLDAAGQKNLQQYLQNVNIPSNINCEIVLELQVKGKRILRVILDDKTSTLKDKKVLAEIKRSLLKWRVPSGAANKILITIKVSS